MIVARRAPADVNAVLADVRLAALFTQFNLSMAAFSEEKASSRPFGCLDLSAVVETMWAIYHMDERPSLCRACCAVGPAEEIGFAVIN